MQFAGAGEEISLGNNRTLVSSQLDAAMQVLDGLWTELAPRFLGLITTSGHMLTHVAGSFRGSVDSLASLASGSFAATRQLTLLMDGCDLNVMYQEGCDVNIYISQVTEDVLLVICFGKGTQLGKVRLMAGRAKEPLALALESADEPAAPVPGGDDYARGVSQAIDELLSIEGEQSGTD